MTHVGTNLGAIWRLGLPATGCLGRLLAFMEAKAKPAEADLYRRTVEMLWENGGQMAKETASVIQDQIRAMLDPDAEDFSSDVADLLVLLGIGLDCTYPSAGEEDLVRVQEAALDFWDNFGTIVEESGIESADDDLSQWARWELARQKEDVDLVAQLPVIEATRSIRAAAEATWQLLLVDLPKYSEE